MPTRAHALAANESPTRPGAGEERQFRPEIQGLRALAVLLVVVYHVWLDRVSGGVDVFLFISAFLLTLSFTRRLAGGETPSLPTYWSSLFRRLLPLAVVTFLGTGLAVYALVPASRWQELQDQILASLFYYQNWLLAVTSVDYYAADHSTASPLQHFWSMSIQGQVFIAWPLILVGTALIARRFSWNLRAAQLCVFAIIFVLSLGFSIHQTSTNQLFAYFDTRARLWEFALGSLLALVLPWLSVPRGPRVLLGWLGLLGIVSLGMILQVEKSFPGYIALWPTLAASFVLIAGQTNSRLGADRILASPLLARMGSSSYALYLVHWPILVITLIVQNRETASLATGTAIIVSSILLSLLLTRFVETPLRKIRFRTKEATTGVLLIAALVAAAAVPTLIWKYTLEASIARAEARGISPENPGALSLTPQYGPLKNPSAEILPPIAVVAQDWVTLERSCQGPNMPAPRPGTDEQCTEQGPQNATRTVAVIGNSHARQLAAPVMEIGEEVGWKVVSINRGGCNYGVRNESRDNSCNTWNDLVRDYLHSETPDVVFMPSTQTRFDSDDEEAVIDLEQSVQELTNAGITVVGVRDNPRYKHSPVDCVYRTGAGSPECAPAVGEKLADENPGDILPDDPRYFSADLTSAYCPDGRCPAVIGRIFVYMDNNHISGLYGRSTAPLMKAELARLTGWPSLQD